MHYTNLGTTGLKVSRICLGMMTYGDPNWREWILSEDDSRPFIKQALDSGINFFDTSDMYSKGVSEVVTGNLLRDMARREEIVVASKCFHPTGGETVNERGLSRKHIMDAIDGTLTRLGMDYVDLYQIHRWDRETPIEETMEALHDVVKAGKARYIGASSMYTWQFAKAQYIADLHGWTRFVSMQNHYNLAYREEEREMNPFCLDQGVGLIPWSPLARGFLTGTRTREDHHQTARAGSDPFADRMYFKDEDFDVVDRVVEVAERLGHTPAQVALAWLLHKPGVNSPIIGATKMNHLDEAIAAVEVVLSDEDIAYMEEPYQPHRILGHM